MHDSCGTVTTQDNPCSYGDEYEVMNGKCEVNHMKHSVKNIRDLCGDSQSQCHNHNKKLVCL
jgi:hypothetical protein